MYLAYHRPAVSYNTAFTREMSMEEITIGTAVMTSSGVKGAFVCGDKIQASSAVYFSSGRSDIRITHRCTEKTPGSYKWRIEGYPYAWFDSKGQFNGYRYIDLTGCKSVTASVLTSAPGAILLPRNSLTGEIVSGIALPNSEGKWIEITAPLTADYTGKYDLTVELSEIPETRKIELDWFRLNA